MEFCILSLYIPYTISIRKKVDFDMCHFKSSPFPGYSESSPLALRWHGAAEGRWLRGLRLLLSLLVVGIRFPSFGHLLYSCLETGPEMGGKGTCPPLDGRQPHTPDPLSPLPPCSAFPSGGLTPPDAPALLPLGRRDANRTASPPRRRDAPASRARAGVRWPRPRPPHSGFPRAAAVVVSRVSEPPQRRGPAERPSVRPARGASYRGRPPRAPRPGRAPRRRLRAFISRLVALPVPAGGRGGRCPCRGRRGARRPEETP